MVNGWPSRTDTNSGWKEGIITCVCGEYKRTNIQHQGGDTVDNQNNRPNRLINEKSPYLLQHAYNPVQWFPWGEEAFEKARLENKPVFLSIGYS